MKKKIVLLTLGIMLVLASCGKDSRIKAFEESVKRPVKISNVSEFKEDVKFFEDNLDLFVPFSKGYDKDIDEDLTFQNMFDNKKINEVTFLKDRLTVDYFDSIEYENGKFITNFATFIDDDKFVSIAFFSDDKPDIKRDNVIEFTALPYKSFDYIYKDDESEVNEKNIVYVAIDYKVVE